MGYVDRDAYGIFSANINKSPAPELMGTHSLTGEGVFNRKHEELGYIKEIMLDMRSGKVAYAVLSLGVYRSICERLWAVPWNALTFDTAINCFILDIDKQSLLNAPAFDPDSWPDMADESWAEKIHSYYGTTYSSSLL